MVLVGTTIWFQKPHDFRLTFPRLRILLFQTGICLVDILHINIHAHFSIVPIGQLKQAGCICVESRESVRVKRLIGVCEAVCRNELHELKHRIRPERIFPLPFRLAEKASFADGDRKTSRSRLDLKVTAADYLVCGYRPAVVAIGQRPLNRTVQRCKIIFLASVRSAADYK